MLTIFTCPKPFCGHIDIIQRNAIKSWTLLQLKPEIILMGEEEGTAKICREFDLQHILKVSQSEYGTPLINSLFAEAEKIAHYPLMCYVNADIIFMSDLIKAINYISRQINSSFLLVGRRWDITINECLNFGLGWEKKLKDLVKKNGTLSPPSAIDYFIFPKGLFKDILPFAVGRPRWDNWMIWKAISLKIPVIDLTSQNIVLHQNHDYSHINQKDYRQKTSPERRYNEDLIGKWWPIHTYNVRDSTYALTKGGLKRTSVCKRVNSFMERFSIGYGSIICKMFYPYSYPLYVLGKSVRITIESIKNLFR